VQYSLKSDGPEERVKTRHAILANLPIPSDIPPDSLKPIVISPPISLHEFLGNAPNVRRNLHRLRVRRSTDIPFCPDF
jgi:hypothetical protein